MQEDFTSKKLPKKSSKYEYEVLNSSKEAEILEFVPVEATTMRQEMARKGKAEKSILSNEIPWYSATTPSHKKKAKTKLSLGGGVKLSKGFRSSSSVR